jgi:hypothetical protein
MSATPSASASARQPPLMDVVVDGIDVTDVQVVVRPQ